MRRARAWFLAALVLAVACKARDETERTAIGAEAPAVALPSKAVAKGRGVPRAAMEADQAGKDDKSTVETKAKVPVPGPRKVVYTGALKLKASDGRATLAKAVALCEGSGGYVESLSEKTVVLRVPAGQFRPIFAALVELGPVLERSIQAEDVTDVYAALELRISILSSSRARLMALLARATDVRSKLVLLGNIRRLTDVIDQLERQRQGYASLLQFSRITLEVVAPALAIRAPEDEPVAAFRWIRALSPFKQEVAAKGRKVKLRVPEGLVKIDRDVFLAESAQGCTFWAHRRENRPRGSTAFWAEAVLARLKPEYAVAELVDLGPFKAVRLLHLNEGTAYRYLVALRADGDALLVAEAQFPNAEAEKRHGEAVRAAIAGGVL